MPRRPDAPPLTRGVVVRGILFFLAVALGVVAAWLIVTSDSQRNIRLGMLAGLWGLLIGCFALFGSRRAIAAQAQLNATEQNATEQAVTAVRAAQRDEDERYEASAKRIRAELELHRSNAVERVEDAAARREWERQLEQLLRGEIRESVNREMSTLRAEVASLRSELLEKVGGQLRLERIETTRVIGSDLEALQEEVRKLKSMGYSTADARIDPRDFQLTHGHVSDPAPSRPVVLPAQVRPVSRQTDQVESDMQPAWHTPEGSVDPEMTAPIAVAPKPQPTPAPMPPADAVDELDGLPRITPFTDFELEPAESGGATAAEYHGRRRRPDDEATGEVGRHADRSTGRRHRRDDDADDVLSRLLANRVRR